MLFVSTILALSAALAGARQLSPEEIQRVYDLAQQDSTLSWENGTLVQCILEREYPSLSVFSTDSPFPLPDPIPAESIPKILSMAQATMQNRPNAPGSEATAPGSLLEDGSSADPASLLMAIMMAERSVGNEQTIRGIGYGDAAIAQLRYTLEEVPRAPSGAISHRADQVQLWSDSVFMVPPSLAFAGVVLNNQTLVADAYEQCELYREGMRNETAGLWAHILLGEGIQDTNRWLTGNAWAAYGMMRVLATITQSPWANDMQSEVSNLDGWVREILGTSQGYMTDNDLLRNYIDDSTTFEDAAGTALMAAAALRMSTMKLTNEYVPMGLRMLAAVSRNINETGHLGQVTDPYSFSVEGDYSPEGQSFVVMAYSAYDDWDAAGREGADGGDLEDGAGRVGVMMGLLAVGVAIGLLGSGGWVMA